jgi:hypothetical protein
MEEVQRLCQADYLVYTPISQAGQRAGLRPTEKGLAVIDSILACIIQ